MTTRADSFVNDPVVFSWRTHRLRERPAMLLAVVPCLLLTAFAGSSVLGSPLAGLLAAGLVAASISDYLFPVRYELRRSGASAVCLFSRQEISWERVRTVWLAEDGVKLSPLARRSRLEAFRGVFLRFGSDREAVLEAVRRLRAEAAGKEAA
jgi:hypothetical protein